MVRRVTTRVRLMVGVSQSKGKGRGKPSGATELSRARKGPEEMAEEID